MTPTSPRQPRPRPKPDPDPPRSSVLDELLCIDGVTDLAVYRLKTGRGQDLVDVPPAPRPKPPQPGEQLGFLFLLSSGGDE